MILACLQQCTSLPISKSQPPPTTQTNVTSAAQVQTPSSPAQQNETHAQSNNKDKDAGERVMYSYAEAVVDTEGTPSVHQLTIAKGKDGEFRFAKNENGTMETGTWKGALPVLPVEHSAAKILGNGVSSIVRQGLIDPLTEFNKNVGNTLQDYIFKKLMPFQFTF